eukprot:gnl/TRDRNA2_/TRDRNA2_177652_c1_seq8.p1 gnl/TRDRNA2_/TRDRNA2_177652_c1~~gnl/TRDRNA2_/TRDRNA2_177652_c1_seq8.p1  ORF type:complete len:581 (-),score=121.37 gnl/TRDRNA2_/TRDRNA2_177652_c1_seq8:94-1722(-)
MDFAVPQMPSTSADGSDTDTDTDMVGFLKQLRQAKEQVSQAESERDELLLRRVELEAENRRLRETMLHHARSAALLGGELELEQADAFEQIAQALCGNGAGGDSATLVPVLPTEEVLHSEAVASGPQDNLVDLELRVAGLTSEFEEAICQLRGEVSGLEQSMLDTSTVKRQVAELGKEKAAGEAMLLAKQVETAFCRWLETGGTCLCGMANGSTGKVARILHRTLQQVYGLTLKLATRLRAAVAQNVQMTAEIAAMNRAVFQVESMLQTSEVIQRDEELRTCLLKIRSVKAQSSAGLQKMPAVFERLWEDSIERQNRSEALGWRARLLEFTKALSEVVQQAEASGTFMPTEQREHAQITMEGGVRSSVDEGKAVAIAGPGTPSHLMHRRKSLPSDRLPKLPQMAETRNSEPEAPPLIIKAMGVSQPPPFSQRPGWDLPPTKLATEPRRKSLPPMPAPHCDSTATELSRAHERLLPANDIGVAPLPGRDLPHPEELKIPHPPVVERRVIKGRPLCRPSPANGADSCQMIVRNKFWSLNSEIGG